ncbi:unnamed protein product [Fraxinus pennsylvanica]|uniref:Pentatricopeptide repeat-containing protein n=1 Tax=Fraxinus pennsylvanica TaxID=56036 RepID=A0AAD2DR93_9LAMI|nr:unnamed protein product [Fraxinus pennsylvanica]
MKFELSWVGLGWDGGGVMGIGEGACAKLGDVLKAKDIHDDAIKYGFGSDLLLGNAMIDIYGKCKYIDDAKIVFDDLRVKDVPRYPPSAFPNVNLALLSISSITAPLPHLWVPRYPPPGFSHVNLALLRYSIVDIVDHGLYEHGHPKEAINFYAEFRNSGKVSPDKLAFLSVVKACAKLGDVLKAKDIHDDAIKYGFGSDLLLGNAMIDIYGKCKYIDDAKIVFDDLRVKDVISGTSLCSCYVNCGLPGDALWAIRAMCLSGTMPNAMTLSYILPACSVLKCLNLGREVHGFGIKNCMEDNMFVNSALVDMYASCSSIKQAEQVFHNMPQHDMVSWNVMISAYFSNGKCEDALIIFDQMLSRGVKLNYDSWNAVICGFMDNGQTQQALELLSRMQQLGFKPNQITIIVN